MTIKCLKALTVIDPSHNDASDAKVPDRPPRYALLDPVQALPPWQRRWDCRVVLPDKTTTIYAIWSRTYLYAKTLRTDHGYSYSGEATIPEYYMTCTQQQQGTEFIGNIDETIQEALRFFLHLRRSMGGQCAFRDIVDEWGRQENDTDNRRILVMQERPDMDGIRHFSAEPSMTNDILCDLKWWRLLERWAKCRSTLMLVDHDQCCGCECIGSFSGEEKSACP